MDKIRVTPPSLRTLAAEVEQMPEGLDKETLREKVSELIDLQGAINKLNRAIRDKSKEGGEGNK